LDIDEIETIVFESESLDISIFDIFFGASGLEGEVERYDGVGNKCRVAYMRPYIMRPMIGCMDLMMFLQYGIDVFFA